MEETFALAAEGLMSIVADLATVAPRESRRIVLPAMDEQRLLVRWLGEVLFLFDGMGWARNIPLQVWGPSGYTDEMGTAAIAETLGYNYVYFPAAVHVESGQNFGTAVLSRWPLSATACRTAGPRGRAHRRPSSQEPSRGVSRISPAVAAADTPCA